MYNLKIFVFFLYFTLFCNAQDQDAKLFFKDGSTLEGLAKITADNNIKFRVTKEDKFDVWSYVELDYVEFYNEDQVFKFKYVYFRHRKEGTLMEVLTEGEISLYSKNPGIVDAIFNSDSGLGFGSNRTSITDVPPNSVLDQQNSPRLRRNLYLKKGAELPVLATVSLLRNWKKLMKDYFKDCPTLVRKIQDNEFGSENMIAMVEFYNDICVGE
jgi:hypothetical protein